MLGYITFSIFSISAFAFFYKGDSIRYSVCYMIGISGLVFFLMNAACIALYEQMEKSANAGSICTDGTDRDLDALLQRADEKMYKNKQKMKRKRRTI